MKDSKNHNKAEKQATVITRLDSLNVGDKYKYDPNDVGIFKVLYNFLFSIPEVLILTLLDCFLSL